jgi:hypothetical protein
MFDDTALAANLHGPASSFLVARTANDLRLVAPLFTPVRLVGDGFSFKTREPKGGQVTESSHPA